MRTLGRQMVRRWAVGAAALVVLAGAGLAAANVVPEDIGRSLSLAVGDGWNPVGDPALAVNGSGQVQVFTLNGGIAAWKDAGLPIES